MKRLVKTMRDLLPVALLLCGAGLLVAAGWIIAPAIGMMIGGVCLIGAALIILRGADGQKE